MQHIDRYYVAIALALLVVGESLGLYIGVVNDMKFRTVHVTMVLPGFVVLTLFGMMFRLWPAMKAGPLAAAQFWLGALSTIAIVIGSVQYVTTGGIIIVAPASLIAIIASILLLWLFWTRSGEA
jgi:hypothetical protein